MVPMSRKLKLRNKFIPVNTPKIFGNENKLVNGVLKLDGYHPKVHM